MNLETQEKFQLNALLLIAMTVSMASFLFADQVNQDEFPLYDGWYATDIMFIITPLIALSMSIKLIYNYKTNKEYKSTWIFFIVFMLTWLAAEQLFDYDLEYDITNLESYIADIFWLVGYVFLFAFSISYLKNLRQSIPKNIILISCLISLMLLFPLSQIVILYGEESSLEFTLAVAYPIADMLILIPTIIGLTILATQKNFVWMLIFLAIISTTIGDIIYLNAVTTDSYDVGHIADIFFLWSYIIFSFGLYFHLKYPNNRKVVV